MEKYVPNRHIYKFEYFPSSTDQAYLWVLEGDLKKAELYVSVLSCATGRILGSLGIKLTEQQHSEVLSIFSLDRVDAFDQWKAKHLYKFTGWREYPTYFSADIENGDRRIEERMGNIHLYYNAYNKAVNVETVITEEGCMDSPYELMILWVEEHFKKSLEEWIYQKTSKRIKFYL